MGTPGQDLSDLAAKSANFGFLLPHLPLLLIYGVGAETAVFSDPNVALYKARQFGEVLAADLVQRGRVKVDGDRQVDRLRALDREGYLHGDVGKALHDLRTVGNQAVHDNLADSHQAFRAVQTCFRLGVWYLRLLTGSRETLTFVPPSPPATVDPASSDGRGLLGEVREARRKLQEARLSFERETSRDQAKADAERAADAEIAQAQSQRSELTRLVDSISHELDALRDKFLEQQAPAPGRRANAERERILSNAEPAANEPLTEVEVRRRLDEMLRQAGWSVQDSNVQLNLYHQGDQRGSGVAAREVQTTNGRADYLLYVDQKLVGVIEAKREGADLTKAEAQADGYAESLTTGQRLAAWRSQLPFRYVSDGGETRFRNTLDPHSRSRRLFSFHQPATLSRWMSQADQDPEAPSYRARISLRLPELDEAGLRPAQIDAIKGFERSISEGRGQGSMGQSRSLIQMATGAGKTFTAVTFAYRLLKHARAERILFLVDRNNLGIQAKAEFENYKTPDRGREFTELYNVQRLAAEPFNPSSKVVVSTIQRLYMSLTGIQVPEPSDPDDPDADAHDSASQIAVSYNPDIPPESFDLVIVDECHRSIYGRWRSVLEYFDAPIVGLTATPVAQTYGYFNGNIVSEYTYEEAVADAVNVDFRVYRIETEITTKGGVIAKGTIPVRDRRTRRQRYQDIDDDVTYGASDVGNNVITRDQLRLVVQTFRDNLFTEIFPERARRDADGKLDQDAMYVPKTLIFARNDNHAEEVVEVVRSVFGRGNEFCAKITHRAKNAGELLSAFRNLPELRVAVTVDMIATGTDVKPLECLVFLRDVRSWAYFEQMKGRGARTLPTEEFERVNPGAGPKTHFVIVDAIGVTEKPKIDSAPLERHTDKQVSLERLLQKAASLTITDDEISTLASRLAKLNLQMDEPERAEVEREAGEPLTNIVHRLVDCVSVDTQDAARAEGGEAAVRKVINAALEPLASKPDLRVKILQIRRAKDILYDETSRDRLLRATAITDNPQVVVSDWRSYLHSRRDEIAALSLAFDQPGLHPRDVLAQLEDLARSIARPPMSWTPERLWRAYAQLDGNNVQGKPRGGIADLLSIVRYELSGGATAGQVLQPYDTVVRSRYAGWLERQRQSGADFTEKQMWWLNKIAEAIAIQIVFDATDLEHPPFSARNGIDGFLADFGDDRANSILDDFDQELCG